MGRSRSHSHLGPPRSTNPSAENACGNKNEDNKSESDGTGQIRSFGIGALHILTSSPLLVILTYLLAAAAFPSRHPLPTPPPPSPLHFRCRIL